MTALNLARRARTPYAVCRANDLAPGARLIVELGGRSVGVFNIGGQFYALHNRCPTRAGRCARAR